uniref:Short-chain dehydrogenase/reductase family protein n=1 Tax=Mycena chlorophos TaxID=658473 RepID=A0ABQ0LRE6_MYCCL|nr:short-chain dehydrogenase/reductase family protein [Mycena chlorophos]
MSLSFAHETTASAATHPTAQEIATARAENIKGKNVLITGTSLNGIGFEVARVIVKHANLVIIAGHNDERLKLSEEAIKKETPSANIRRLILDISSLAAVRKAAAEVNTYPEPLDVLIHNAAAGLLPFRRTVDGYESQIATSHIGPFLFTKLLASKLLASRLTPRMIYTSSSLHADGVNLDLLKTPDETTYTTMGAYGEAKAALILTAIAISRLSRGKILGFSLHPGIINTNINNHPDALPLLKSHGVMTEDGQPNTKDFQWKTLGQGAATTIAAAFDPSIESTPGVYLDDCKVANDHVLPRTSDPAVAERLWIATEEIVGEKFEF